MENIDTTFLAVNEEFKSLQLNKQVDFDKFNFYATTAHSTAIEGSTLSVNDTTLLLDNKMPIQGKSMLEMDMVRDHYQALLYAKANAENKLSISIQFIQELNRRLMKNSGSIINTALGSTDTSNGDIRKFAVLS
ncbi:MAG: hypothetical protein ACKVOU_09440, partial [Cytophagales bacterium]